LNLSNQVLGFLQSFEFVKVGFLGGGYFPSFSFSKIGVCLFLAQFHFWFCQVSAQPPASKIGFVGFGQSSGKQAFSFGKVNFQSKSNFRLSQVSEIGFKVFNQGFGKLASGFLSGSLFLAKALVGKVIFSASVLVGLVQAFWYFRSFGFSKVRLVKNCRACKIKSIKAWFCF
jgi:hypothetical protein